MFSPGSRGDCGTRVNLDSRSHLLGRCVSAAARLPSDAWDHVLASTAPGSRERALRALLLRPSQRPQTAWSCSQASGLEVHFGGVHAVDGVDLVLRKGEILGLIGPNGAGKTTLVNALSGFQKLTAGTVEMNGRRRHRAEPPSARPPRPRAHVPVGAPLPGSDRAGERRARRSRRRHAPAGRPRWARELLERLAARRQGQPLRNRSAARARAAARNRARARCEAHLPDARRAGRRAQRAGERRARRLADADP